MDSSNHSYSDEEYIRHPDMVVNEQLIPDTKSDFDKELEEALYLSMKETILEQQKNQEYEDELINNYFKETCERREKFKDLLFDLRKLAKFDKTIQHLYQIVEPIIDSYCNQVIEKYNIDEETYTSIFKTLSTIRTNKKNIEFLKSVILLN